MSEPVPLFASVTGGSSCGRRGLPRELVDRIYSDYLRLRSCTKVAELHNRSRQSIYELLKTHKRQRYARQLKTGEDVIIYDGIKFTKVKRCGSFRAGRHETITGEKFLHRRIWAAANGPIPPGMEIVHVDGNKRNFALSNLAMTPRTAQSRQVSGGNNQHTVALAKERLAKHERWVMKQAQWWHSRNPTVELQDLIQEGRIAILEAHKRYEQKAGANFLTFATYHIRHRMQAFVFKAADTIRIKSRKWENRIPVSSLDAVICEGGDATLHEFIAAPESGEQLIEDNDTVRLVTQAMGKLNPREQAVLKARFIEERTLEDISRDYGVTRERIRQIEAQALRKLRQNPLLKKAP